MRSTKNALSSITQEQVSVNPGESQTHQFQLQLWSRERRGSQQCRFFVVRRCSKQLHFHNLHNRLSSLCSNSIEHLRSMGELSLLNAGIPGSNEEVQAGLWHRVQDVPIFFETKPTEWSLQPRTLLCSNYQSHPATRWGLLWPSIHRELRMEEWRLTGTRGPRLGNPKV